jgi:Sap, sulfolipid-1-addressing protein
MNVEVLILAAASAVRPSTSTAAVYALLSSDRPRPVLAAFTVAGLLFSCAIGFLVVSAFHGVSLPGRESTRTAIIELAAGAAMLGFASGAWAGHVERFKQRRGERSPSRLMAALRRPTVKVAAAAGVVTHLPGLFYFVALNAIAGGRPPFGPATVEVLTYNAIWFSVPVAAFVVAREHADLAHARIARLNAWAKEHEQAIVVALFATVGAYLVVKGLDGLLS